LAKSIRKPLAVAVSCDESATEWLQCVSCDSRFVVAPLFFGCPACRTRGEASEIEMHYARRPLVAPESLAKGIWGWQSHLPAISAQARITLGEGNTALLPVGESTPGPAVYLKNETTNPTWSWKDRPNAISVSMAKHFGYEQVVAISTGNHGNAMSAMAASGGIRPTVLCNATAPALQLALMHAYGAHVVRGGQAEAIVLELILRGDWFPCTIYSLRGAYSNPFGIEGFKTIAFEIFQQIGRMPDRVFVGVGSGDGIYGIWKGFRELRDCGVATRVPRIIGCQTTGANSLVRAFRDGARTITPLRELNTVAASLAEFAAGRQALRAVYESEGEALEVSDEEALDAMHWMAKRGIALEPSSAVPLACLRKARANERNDAETWVTIGSGAAPKWPEDVLRGYTMPAILSDDQEVLP
jgi:threonine synthase